MPRAPILRPLLVSLVAGACGHALNRHGLEVFGSTPVAFGGVFSLAAAWCYGPGWGGLAAVVAGAGFPSPANHPWGLVFAAAEAIVTGWLVRGGRTAGPDAAVRFWAGGAPAAALLLIWARALPFPSNWALTLALPANGLLNALLANALLARIPVSALRRAGVAEASRRLSLDEMLFRRFAGFAVLPMAAVALLAGRAFDRQVRERAAVEIQTAAQDIAARLDGFLREHERAVGALADQLTIRPGDEAPTQFDLPLFLLRRRYPAFQSVRLADSHGFVVAASPDRDLNDRAVARRGFSIADEDPFQIPAHTRQAFVGDATRDRPEGGALVVTVGAPMVRNGRVAGVLVAAAGLSRPCATLTELATAANRDLVVVDSAGRVVLSVGRPALQPLEYFAGSSLQAAAAAADTPVFHHDWLPPDGRRAESLLAVDARAGLSGWTIYLQEPLWRSMRVVAGFYLGALATCAAVAAGVFRLARHTVARITGPLEQLAAATRALASDESPPSPVPGDAPAEIVRIADDVGTAARAISDRNRRLTAALAERESLNAELNQVLCQLDQKVQDRTAALAAKNLELERLFAAQQEAQHAVAESDRRFRTVLEHLSEVVFQADRQGRWTLLSPAWKRLTGIGEALALGHPVADSLHADDREECGRQIDELLDDASPGFVRRARLDREDGGFCWVQISARPTRAADGVVTGIAGTLGDVTTLVEHEEALRLSRRRFDLAVRGSGSGLWDWDLDTGGFYFSPRAKELIGYADADFSNHSRDWMRALHPADQRRVLRVLRRSIAGRNPVFELEVRLRHRDGSWRWILGRGAALHDEQGRTLRLAGSLTDVSDRKRAQDALEERSTELSVANAQLARAARLKDEFLASMSHELRTPLNAVLGMAEVLQEGIPGPLVAAQRECVQTIAEAGRHLLDLINDILDLSKIEAGKISITRETVLVRDIVQASLRFIKESAQKKNLQVVAEIRDAPEHVAADARRLKQILINLLANAVKFTPPGGRLGIEVGRPPGREALAFTVWDTGIGIAAADLARLFQPFVQVDSKLARQYGGTGLGLAIVRKLAELHDGSVAVESRPGEGSRFSVLLPLGGATDDSPPPAEESEADSAPLPDPPRALRVLLVEDNERNIATFRRYLEAHGCTLTVAATGPEGLERARHTAVDVVVLDMQLPGMDGFEVLSALRQHAATEALPVVAVTALSMPGDRERCLAAGAGAYLEKPVRLRTLLDTVRTAAAPAGPPLLPK